MKKLFACLLILLVLASCAGAEGTIAYESPLNFAVDFDPELFEAEDDCIRLSGIGDSVAYLAVQSYEGYTADELIEALILQSGTDAYSLEDAWIGTYVSDGYSVPCLSYATGESAGDILFTFCPVARESDVLLVEIGCSLDVLESVAGYFEEMIQTFRLADFTEEWAMNGTPSVATAKEKVRCDVCGGWYEAGNVFRNHICAPQVQEQYEYPKADSAEMAYCDVCGGWYEAGNVFRNHICKPQVQEQYEYPAADSAEMAYCDVCGGWYEAGNVFRNHICTPMN